MQIREYITASPEETEQLAISLIPAFEKASVVALQGDLGAGKTAFVRGLARGMECIDMVSSPTYTIVNEYRGKRKLCHFDVYRLGSGDDLWEIGWADYLASGALCVVEWAQRTKDAFPPDTIVIEIEKLGETERKITIYADTCS